MTIEILSERFIHARNPKFEPDKLPLRSNSIRSDSSPEFDFPLCKNPDQEFSHADELFSDGKILPFGIKNQQRSDPTEIRIHRQFISSEKQSFDKNSSRVKRSRSLGCGSGLFPLSLLSRSKSEGSPRHTKNSKLVWDKDQDNSQKKKKKDLQKTNSYQRRPSRTSSGQMNPVLNVPLADMFCLNSFFSAGKDHTNKGK